MKYIIISLSFWLSAILYVSAQGITEIHPQDSVYWVVENMPEFSGGQGEMLKYISSNLEVNINWDEHEMYRERFVAQFVVTRTGDIRNIEVKYTTYIPELDSIYCDLIKKMPPWKPGTMKGKEVDVYYTIPISVRFQR